MNGIGIIMYKMKEPIVCCDVDDTLILFAVEGGVDNHPDAIEMSCGPLSTVKVVPHKRHIEYLKNLHANGFHIIVWSAAGMEWAAEAVEKLGLNQFEPFDVKKKIIEYQI